MFLNEKFNEFRARSFYLNGIPVCEVLVLFFKFEKSRWCSLNIGEGVAIFTSDEPESEVELNLSLGGDVDYPVMRMPVLNDFVGKKIHRIFEYRIEGLDEGCVGVYFDCGVCGFSVVENNGCLSFVSGVSDFEGEVFLVEKDFI